MMSVFLSLISGLARQQAQVKREKMKTLPGCAGRDSSYYERDRLINEAYELEQVAQTVDAMIDREDSQLDALESYAQSHSLPEALVWLKEKRALTPSEEIVFVVRSNNLKK